MDWYLREIVLFYAPWIMAKPGILFSKHLATNPYMILPGHLTEPFIWAQLIILAEVAFTVHPIMERPGNISAYLINGL